jgi:hypothetical protein
MIFMVILLAIAAYIAIAVAFVLYVWRRTKKKSHLWLAIAVVILLPTWDAVLGYVVYYPACLFIPKSVIYETAETEGIYYEGDINNYVKDLSEISGKDHKILLFADRDLEKGYKYVESLVTEYGKKYSERKSITPTIYRCGLVPSEPGKLNRLSFNCVPTHDVHSGYTVKSTNWKLGLTEVRFVKISNRSSGRIMAEYGEVTRWINILPFFGWLNLGDGSAPGVSCPPQSRYYDFHYEVLKIKK